MLNISQTDTTVSKPRNLRNISNCHRFKQVWKYLIKKYSESHFITWYHIFLSHQNRDMQKSKISAGLERKSSTCHACTPWVRKGLLRRRAPVSSLLCTAAPPFCKGVGVAEGEIKGTAIHLGPTPHPGLVKGYPLFFKYQGWQGGGRAVWRFRS